MRDGLVPQIVARLADINGPVEPQRTAGKIALHLYDACPFGRGIIPRHQAGGCDSARVDEGVDLFTPVLFDGNDGIERQTRRVDADLILYRLRSQQIDILRHGEYFGDALDRHHGTDVAFRIDGAVSGDQRDAEDVR